LKAQTLAPSVRKQTEAILVVCMAGRRGWPEDDKKQLIQWWGKRDGKVSHNLLQKLFISIPSLMKFEQQIQRTILGARGSSLECPRPPN